jgi:hypothetical protein
MVARTSSEIRERPIVFAKVQRKDMQRVLAFFNGRVSPLRQLDGRERKREEIGKEGYLEL